ncbi:unnamed protein product [Moneuplotes crassus]|uniref:Uncharacterized protein n=1 Tax=Euplotes crassus TaxID=5936 RepID=A0AAD1XC38_EUPCR|nr:unnamed protein product [Moneuplotes crassus]
MLHILSKDCQSWNMPLFCKCSRGQMGTPTRLSPRRIVFEECWLSSTLFQQILLSAYLLQVILQLLARKCMKLLCLSFQQIRCLGMLGL